jgi:hypothetical protein
MNKKEYRIKNTVKDGVTYIQIDEHLIRNIKMKPKFKVGEWLPLQYAYMFVYDELIEKLDFVMDKVLEGKFKIYEVDKITDTSWIEFKNSKCRGDR